jgi:phosphatidylserine/phosphatidylglycerophosphate/cardiolipin synthase-like enzyme
MYKYLSITLIFCSPVEAADISIYFSPKGGAKQALIRELDKAEKVICVQAYSFTDKEIAAALNRAAERKVAVAICIDEKRLMERHCVAVILDKNIHIYSDAKHAIAHNKIILIDNEVVITGSYNFSAGAELRNAENLLIIKDSTIFLQYKKNWEKHIEHSKTITRINNQ